MNGSLVSLEGGDDPGEVKAALQRVPRDVLRVLRVWGGRRVMAGSKQNGLIDDGEQLLRLPFRERWSGASRIT